MIGVLCITFGLLSSVVGAELVPSVINVGVVKSGSEISGETRLFSSEIIEHAQIDFGCSCGTSVFRRDSSGGELLFAYTPVNIDGGFRKVVSVRYRTAGDESEKFLPAIISGVAWMPLHANRTSLVLDGAINKRASVEFTANLRVSDVKVTRVGTLHNEKFIMSSVLKGDVGVVHPVPLTINIEPNLNEIKSDHFDALCVEYSYIENNHQLEGELRVPIFFKP